MVFFCCNGCGETFKKQKVEQHPFSCRSSVSCIDCNINFQGNEYKKHTQCVSEAERYQGNLYDGKENKGALKQNSWMESVRSAADACKNNAQLKGLLVRIAENDNVPRKKTKFLNFIKNSMKVGNKTLVEKAWEEIEKAGKESSISGTSKVDNVPSPSENDEEMKKTKSKNSVDNETTSNVSESRTDEDDPPLSKKERKKRKRLASEDGANLINADKKPDSQTSKSKKKKPKNKETNSESNQNFGPNLNHINGVATETPGKTSNLVKLIQDLVFEKEEISVKKLKRKVTAAYLESKPHKTPEEVSRLFDKKLAKIPGVAVEQGTASKEILDVS